MFPAWNKSMQFVIGIGNLKRCLCVRYRLGLWRDDIGTSGHQFFIHHNQLYKANFNHLQLGKTLLGLDFALLHSSLESEIARTTVH